MKMKRILALMLCAAVLIGVCCGCSASRGGMKDGYYTAEMAEYANGWKEFVTLHIEDNTIISLEYNAKNASGFIKSWDMAYMRRMNGVAGTYPNYYTRAYARQVIEKQSGEAGDIDTVAGATSSGNHFRQLVAAALELARAGKNEVAIVA